MGLPGMQFRHSISIEMKNCLPIRGRLYPAHYSLLCFTRGKPKTFRRIRDSNRYVPALRRRDPGLWRSSWGNEPTGGQPKGRVDRYSSSSTLEVQKSHPSSERLVHEGPRPCNRDDYYAWRACTGSFWR
jgi:hypothetical protein